MNKQNIILVDFPAKHPPGNGVVNSEAFEPQPFILTDDDRDFFVRCWIVILLGCAVFWVAVIKFIVLPLFA